ncbi:hypothetical protein [Bdellovibrio svalbardensis]|uniref:Bdellovibrio beta-sandwich domain-containing protein n=1 Tax=Bdellovibrio svalbardensis TaxID=2972972 RepID=A0ABT6DLD5_9BACT|nr:hypothetical protein [Bdellovibrio svalbardensis]MDG0817688.1 hypothetical protein [Bdellovibrio svalbardensis]
MKKLMLLVILTVGSLAQASESIAILNCNEKFSSFTIEQNGDSYDLKRSVLTNRVKGHPYVSGGVSTESYGSIHNAQLVSAAADKVVFSLANGNFLNILIVPGAKSEILTVKFESNEDEMVSSLHDILKTSENPLEFYDSEACQVKF